MRCKEDKAKNLDLHLDIDGGTNGLAYNEAKVD